MVVSFYSFRSLFSISDSVDRSSPNRLYAVQAAQNQPAGPDQLAPASEFLGRRALDCLLERVFHYLESP